MTSCTWPICNTRLPFTQEHLKDLYWDFCCDLSNFADKKKITSSASFGDVLYTAESVSAVWCTPRSLNPRFDALAMGSIPRSFLKIEYLGKIVTKFENTLICLSGAQWFESWKYSGKKSPNTPLKSFNTLRKSNKMSYPVYFVIFVD